MSVTIWTETTAGRSTRTPHPLEGIRVTTHGSRIYLSVHNVETPPLARADVAALIDLLCEAVKETEA